MSTLWRLLSRQPWCAAAWRGPVFALLVWRPWSAVVAAVAVVGLLAVAGKGGAMLASTVQLYGVAALVIAMLGGTVGRDRGSARHFILFQRSGSEVGHYLRLWTLAFCCILAIVCLLVGLLLLQTGTQIQGKALLVGTLTFATMLAATSMLATTLVRSGDAALVVAWSIAPLLTTIVAKQHGLSPAASAMLEIPFVPLNAVFALQSALAADSWAGWRPWWGAQLALYPAACIGLGWLRLRALERRGAE